MFKKEGTVKNETGLHARPASDFAALCRNVQSDIRIISGNAIVNPKSIISILSAGLSRGTTFLLEVEGPDEKEAGEKIVQFIEALKE